MGKKRQIVKTNSSSLSFFDKKLKFNEDSAVATCPICHKSLWSDSCWNNLHVDACLKKNDSANKQKHLLPCLNSFSSNDDVYQKMLIQQIDGISGLWLISNFLTEEEETKLLTDIDSLTTSWRHSTFNGHCTTKYYGCKTQFGLLNEIRMVRQNENQNGEQDIPDFLAAIMERLRDIVNVHSELPCDLRGFCPNECNINNYLRCEQHYLRPHFDDRALSGPLLINLSLAGFAKMTYSIPNSATSLSVDLPRRSLQLVTGKARWSFMHEIKAQDIFDDRRVSVTWRQCGNKHTGVAEKRVDKDRSVTALLTKADKVMFSFI